MENNSIFAQNYFKIKNIVDNIEDITDLDKLHNLLNDANTIQKEYENLQLVVKRNGNSLYGSSASIYFSLPDFDIAEDITMTAKNFCIIVDKAFNNFFVNWGEEELKIIQTFYPDVIRLHKFKEYVPDTKNDVCQYGDTDSRYLDVELVYSFLITENGPKKLPEDDKELVDFCLFLDSNFFKPIIKNITEKECDLRNGRKGHLRMALEVIGRKCIFHKKKKYIFTQIWKDGKLLKKPKIKWQGVEIKQGKMSPRMKKILGLLIEKYLLQNYDIEMLQVECKKLIKYIKHVKQKDFIYQITSVSGFDCIHKNSNGLYEATKTHIQIQLVVNWLNFLEKNNLKDQYKKPFEGQKMNYYYCSPQSGYKVIGIPDDVDINTIPNLPEPNWNKQIESTLIKPLLNYIQNNSKKITELDTEAFLLGVKRLN